MSPRVSVIIPTFRRGDLLRETLASVKAQTFDDFECLLVEDGSDPSTLAAFEELCSGDARFAHVVLPHSGMPGRTRNQGIERARGELCAFVDDDDLWLPDKLRRQVALLDAEPDVGLCCTRIEEFGARQALWPSGQVPREIDLAKLLTGNFVATSTVLVRRSLLQGLGGFSEELPRAQDYDLWLRCALGSRLVFLDEVLCRYRTHHGNISTNQRLSMSCVESIFRRLHAERKLTDRQLQRALSWVLRARARHEPSLGTRWALRTSGAVAAAKAVLYRQP